MNIDPNEHATPTDIIIATVPGTEAEPEAQNMILTTGYDCSVRMWTY